MDLGSAARNRAVPSLCSHGQQPACHSPRCGYPIGNTRPEGELAAMLASLGENTAPERTGWAKIPLRYASCRRRLGRLPHLGASSPRAPPHGGAARGRSTPGSLPEGSRRHDWKAQPLRQSRKVRGRGAASGAGRGQRGAKVGARARCADASHARVAPRAAPAGPRPIAGMPRAFPAARAAYARAAMIHGVRSDRLRRWARRRFRRAAPSRCGGRRCRGD